MSHIEKGLAALQARVDALEEEEQAARTAAYAAEPVEPVDPERRFAEQLAEALQNAQSPWYHA